jgi:asparagine synthetase B (glutamine-hydrolysing)
MTGVRVVGSLDPTAAWDGTRVFSDDDLGPGTVIPERLRGAAVAVRGDEADGWRLFRDPLGIDKLFWVRDRDRGIVVSARPRRLVDAGHRFEDVFSMPSGTVIDIAGENGDPRLRSIVPSSWFAGEGGGGSDVEELGSRIRITLESYLGAVASTLRPKNVFVCLSGGLDSSGIAAIARQVFPTAVAVSFDLKRSGGSSSDDRDAAERVARDLKMPLRAVTVTEDELLDHLDMVLIEGIDWRDFNVHAALVNAALAQAIAHERDKADVTLVLTGDLANEFLVDYEPESYGDGTYYRLPRLRPAALRTSLVRGLDTCNREIGIFSAFDLHLVQPYAVAVDEYLRLPEEFLRREDRKQVLSRAIFGSLVPDHVYARKKVRAQIGSTDGGGTLAACLDRGIDQRWLRRRFCELHEIADEGELDRFMRAGRYRSAVPSPAER